MGRKGSAKKKPSEPEALARFRTAVSDGKYWFEALLEAIAGWEMPEENAGGRHYRYLIGGEAFDWLLLAERLCEAADGAIPAEESEALLFFGRLPREMEQGEFRRAIGDAKHRAHLNFLYGVTAEEALQLVVEEEVRKDMRSSVLNQGEDVDSQVFERIYGRSHEDLLDSFRAERSLPAGDEISYAELRDFTYWLFKYRVSQSDPARVASDTRRALAHVSQLEAAVRRRAEHLASPETNSSFVVDGEVVAHVH